MTISAIMQPSALSSVTCNSLLEVRLSGLRGDSVRFIVAGVLNTGLTLCAYQIFLIVLSPSVAYACSWLLGLVFVAVVYPNKVFKGGNRRLRDRVLVAITYCSVFVIGLLLLQLLQRFSIDPRHAIFLVIATTTIFNFFIARWILRT